MDVLLRRGRHLSGRAAERLQQEDEREPGKLAERHGGERIYEG
jgi:hypothetical protein